MKYLFWLLLLTGLPNSLYAKETSYDWVIEQYQDYKISETPEVRDPVEGQIDGEGYVGFIARRVSPLSDDDRPTVLIFKKTRDGLAITASADLPSFNYTDGYSVVIENDSIYINRSVGHHGLHSTRYQFKKIDHTFKMIRYEYQSQVLACDAGDESPSCAAHVVWSGISYNFIKSSVICWQEKFSLNDKEVSRRYSKWLQPKNGVKNEMVFRMVKLPLLDGFNEADFQKQEFKECYFEKNKHRSGRN